MVDGLEIVAEGNVLKLQATGKLTKEMYQEFVPLFEQMVTESGKIRVLFEMHDFHGWTAGALWEDMKFDFKHFSDIERLALVGESKWQEGMAVFCKPFTGATIKYFDQSQVGEAEAWIAE